MRIQILGCGDAFGSGGRFNTCFYVEGETDKFLIDCGASSLIALKRFNIDPSSIDNIFLTHLHGDHFGGIPFLERYTQIETDRKKPLLVVGPDETQERINKALEIFFPGATAKNSNIPIDVQEYQTGEEMIIGNIKLKAFQMIHTRGTNPHALRIEFENKVITYSGDTEWNDDLIQAAMDADLFICEAFKLKHKRNHMDYETLERNQDLLCCERIVLTHMSEEVLMHSDKLNFECAYDGMSIKL